MGLFLCPRSGCRIWLWGVEVHEVEVHEVEVHGMTDLEILDRVRGLGVRPDVLNRVLRNHHGDLYGELVGRTSFLDEVSFRGRSVPILARLYCLERGISSAPECSSPTCHNPVAWRNGLHEFAPYCCRACYLSDPNSHSREEATRRERYGDPHYCNSEKARQTKLERYGDSNYCNREKFRQTCMERFGGSSPASSKAVVDKARRTCMERYGVESPMQLGSIREKARNTCLERYGVGNPSQVESVREKVRETCRSRWGVESPVEAQVVRDRARETCRERYGSDTYLGSREYHESNGQRLLHRRFLRYSSCSEVVPAFSESELEPLDSGRAYPWRCLRCGSEFGAVPVPSWPGYLRGIGAVRCPVCHPLDSGFSAGEKELAGFIRSIYGGAVVENDRTVVSPRELDIWLPDRALAFEYDGVYWHGESNQPDRNYHLDKTRLCEGKGIHLVHIWDCEWQRKGEVARSRIRNLLGSWDRVVYARSCEVREVPSAESLAFQSRNHIQGGVNSRVNLGLYLGDELVSLMTFSKPRFSRRWQWELVRFCNLLNCHVPGAASRLFSWFCRNWRPSSVVSYADRRWSMDCGSVLYRRLGFRLERESGPNYWYFREDGSEGGLLHNRMEFQRHRLPQLLPEFDPSLSEAGNMALNGWDRVWDCGNLTFVREF